MSHKDNVLRTFVYHRDLIIDISHFTTDTLDLVIDPCYFTAYALDLVIDPRYFTTYAFNAFIDPCYFVVNAMSKRQELCRRHPNFILCQFIQSFERVLDLRLSQQLLQILFWSTISETETKNTNEKFTCSSMLYLLRRDSENIQYFHHYLHNDICHCLVWFDLRIRLQTFEKVFNAFENVNQGVLRRVDILDRLTSFDVKLGLQKEA